MTKCDSKTGPSPPSPLPVGEGFSPSPSGKRVGMRGKTCKIFFLSGVPKVVITFFLLLSGAGLLQAADTEAPVLVAAASNLSHALDAIIADYQAGTDARVQVSYGSSGNLTQQILQGAADIDAGAVIERVIRIEAG